jgi:hypothetical protein
MFICTLITTYNMYMAGLKFNQPQQHESYILQGQPDRMMWLEKQDSYYI